ncbi:hypothetical protein ACFWXO_16585 [Kitasatospora sp. NPDC059088]|uniref:hypothetical protein n=1 Tax=Kitasatospora sp. NPDC059088 TaxID=3346722 RepID=UPI0036980D2E
MFSNVLCGEFQEGHLLIGTAQTVARGVGPAGSFCVTMGLAVAFRQYFIAYFTV